MLPDVFLPSNQTGTVYGLFASDEPLQLRYIGQTRYEPIARLRSHLSKSGLKGSAGKWLQEVLSRGAKVGMRILGEYPLERLTSYEYRWIVFWAWFCDVENGHLPNGCDASVRQARIERRRRLPRFGQAG